MQQSAAETDTLKFCLLHLELLIYSVEYFFVLFCILFICLIFFVFSFDCLFAGVCVVYKAPGWVTVSASLPCGRFFHYLGCGVTPSHLSVPLPLCSIIIVMWLLKDN